ncbi:MAG: tetratricopeptide repeat protein [Xenococcaceae cyanobacterium MO_188.B29]|nr:tetratricopeptide repeat protein [Xenococcaceae cyanobacterium MO_188.B29]
MVKTLIVKPLGLVLQKAGLISDEQLATALQEKTRLSNLKIGEIMAIRGWVKLETANFFAEKWPQLLNQFQDKPLGQHFKEAALLSEYQINDILQQQQRTGLKFGSVAVLNGLVSQSTVDFFLEQLELIHNIDSELEGTVNINYIENYLLKNQKCDPVDLLELYQQIWQQQEINSIGSEEEKELVDSGLITISKGKLKLANPIYRSIFNQSWIDRELDILQPYGRIRLKIFGIETKASSPYQVLQEVRTWTGNQPFLSQKLYQIIRNGDFFIAEGKEAQIIGELVQIHIIDDWQHKSAAKHLQQLSDRLTQNKQCAPLALLKTYKKIWLRGELLADESLEQAELLDIGLIKRENNKVAVANRIYQSVFNQSWIEEQSVQLIPPIGSIKIIEKEPISLIKYPFKHKKTSKMLRIILVWLALISAGVIGINFWLKIREERLFQAATIRLQRHEYEMALANYNQVLQIDNENYQAWHNRGYALGGLRQYQEMLQSCSSATAIQPDAKDSWNCQGEALYYLDRYEEAVTAFDQAIALDAQESSFWLNKSDSLLKLQQIPAALEAINNVIALLETRKSEHNSERVKADLQKAWNNRGQAMLQKQEYNQAIDAFKQALSYDRDYLPAQWGKAQALQKLGHYLEAKIELDLILERRDLSNSQKSVTWFYQGLNWCESGDVASGVKALAMAIELDPNYEEAKTAKVKCLESE